MQEINCKCVLLMCINIPNRQKKKIIMIQITWLSKDFLFCECDSQTVSTCPHSSCRTSTRYIFSRPAVSGTHTYKRTSWIFNHRVLPSELVDDQCTVQFLRLNFCYNFYFLQLLFEGQFDIDGQGQGQGHQF